MPQDEQQIRDLVERFWSASQAGDVDTVLSLMTEDVVFLVAGRPPMDKREFASLACPPAGNTPRPTMAVKGVIREVSVSGDVAFLWSELAVTVQPPGAASVRRAGHTLSVFRRVSGRWLLARDANLLVLRN